MLRLQQAGSLHSSCPRIGRQHSVGLQRRQNISNGKYGCGPSRRTCLVQAVISDKTSSSSGGGGATVTTSVTTSEKGAMMNVRAVVLIRKKLKEDIKSTIFRRWESLLDGMTGQNVLLELVSRDVDPDFSAESRIEKPGTVYVPRDETFEEIKQSTFSAGALKALFHNLIPSLVESFANANHEFGCFSEIDQLYTEGRILKFDQGRDIFNKLVLPKIVNKIRETGEQLLRYETPSIISRDRFAWLRDNEFARQVLAGVNPVNIERLKEFPIVSKLDPAIYGSPESAIKAEHIEAELRGMSVKQALEEKKLFILDYHDTYMPFVGKINSLEGRKVYASRTLFLLTDHGTLEPIIIELSLPPTMPGGQSKRVFTHGHDSTSYWLWKLAKAHVASNDAGIHQLVNHWLRTHACMEPYIIAAHRQLSFMHPIFKLLQPHMRYTMEINALARQSLINGGGVIEACFTPGKYSMEMSAYAYDKQWRFDMEALPADLIRRGMAFVDPTKPNGLRLVIEDYPYAADGLLIWSAIKEWVEDYISIYYSEPNSIPSDIELQAWWNEAVNKGHYDKRNATWWPKLKTKEDLAGVLTTIIWVASGQHAALNFGQYPYGGYVPNRPCLMRSLIPKESDPEYKQFISNPQSVFLASMPTQLQATKTMAVVDTLSTHSPDEEYLGERHESRWTNDQRVQGAFEKFSAKIQEIEEIIDNRNEDLTYRNRNGAGVLPYELLMPSSGPGVTGRGVPNSISI
ncbi:linoleate 13S-lipoxygenase 3-1, chloroplastic isoform X2 [Cryptomeria japonica]|uniref:linoleate 13S-lipoxygenase 3-1, chloroplastic isoform X2 n=1 Tax=Cryptomeria japonica TaxID=3369 RepID=UPI0027DA2AC1|nr:linoleate 13S-lipoxygenase 3-1, chloroplastic isoform X2 [Cryptomeria japonica]